MLWESMLGAPNTVNKKSKIIDNQNKEDNKFCTATSEYPCLLCFLNNYKDNYE